MSVLLLQGYWNTHSNISPKLPQQVFEWNCSSPDFPDHQDTLTTSMCPCTQEMSSGKGPVEKTAGYSSPVPPSHDSPGAIDLT